MTWPNTSHEYMNYTFNEGLIMLAVDFVLFSILGLYLDNVLPREFGKRHPVFFCCMRRYYSCCSRQPRDLDDDEVSRRSTLLSFNGRIDNDDFEGRHLKPENYEHVATRSPSSSSITDS